MGYIRSGRIYYFKTEMTGKNNSRRKREKLNKTVSLAKLETGGNVKVQWTFMRISVTVLLNVESLITVKSRFYESL